MPVGAVPSDSSVYVFGGEALHRPFGSERRKPVFGGVQRLELLRRCISVEDAVGVDACDALFRQLDRVSSRKRCLLVCAGHRFVVERTPYTVGVHVERVDGERYLAHVLDVRTLVQEISVHHFEIAVESDERMFFSERFPAVGDVSRDDRLRPQVFELLSVVEVQEEVFLVGGKFQFPFFRPDDMGVLKTV